MPYFICLISNLPRDVNPLSSSGGGKNRIQHHLRREAVAEGGTRGLAGLEALQEVGEGVREGVLVTDRAAWDPPLLHVGVLEAGDVDGAPSVDVVFIAVVVELQPVRVFQVEVD